MDWTGWISSITDTLSSVLGWVKDNFVGIARWALDHLKNVWGVLKSAVSGVLKALRTLTHFKWRELWHLLKKGYDQWRKWVKWYQDHVLGPIRRMHRQLMEIYNRIFRPVLEILDMLRRTVGIIGIFNRKLARKLDSALWGLESRLLDPWYRAMRRLNSLSSWAMAIITRSGLFDRTIFVQTLRRDWKSVWKVLLNNGHFPSAGAPRVPFAGLADVHQNFMQYYRDRSGPLRDEVDSIQRDFEDIRAQIG